MNREFKSNMNKIIKDICYLLAPFALFLFISSLLNGQQQQTIFATIATNSVQGTNTFTNIPGQYMIGQSIHIFTIHEKNSPGHVCTDYFTNQIYGSYGDTNGGTLVRFPLQQVLVSAFQQDTGTGAAGAPYFATRVYQAQGAFPQVSVGFNIVGNITNCVYDIEYSGVLYTGSISNITNNGFQPSSLRRVTITGALGAGGAGITGAQTGFIGAIYGLKLCNNTAATTYTIQSGVPNNTVLLVFYALAVGQCVDIPLSNIPFITQTSGDASLGIAIVPSGASTMTLTFLFRFE